MTRVVAVAAAQMGPTQRADTRAHTLDRIITLLEQAASKGAKLVVFPELAFTTFFPRWLLTAAELAPFTEPAMPNPAVQPLFDRARALGVGFSIGYAEQAGYKLFNTAILVGPDGGAIGTYRKIHLPGSVEPRPGDRFQQLEKRYFSYGDEGFPAWRVPAFAGGVMGMMICNDRRWPESWRMLGLQGVELVCCGYNSAAYDPNGGTSEDGALRTFHAQLVVQANAYMNATWAVAVAKAGEEDGSGLIGGSCIVDPNGLIVAQASTLGDEVIVAECDLDACRQGKDKMFNFAAHRRPEWYGAITEQTGAYSPRDPALPLLHLDRTIEELEGEVWGPSAHDSGLGQRLGSARKVKLRHLSNEQLRLTLSQDCGKEFTVPLALARLQKNSLADGGAYPGDIFTALLRLPAAFWRDRPDDRQALGQLWLDFCDGYPADTIATLHRMYEKLKAEEEAMRSASREP